MKLIIKGNTVVTFSISRLKLPPRSWQHTQQAMLSLNRFVFSVVSDSSSVVTYMIVTGGLHGR